MFKEMKTYAHLKPGQKGMRRLVETYGEKLLCVRYRYDEKRGVKVKTVEIIVDEKPLRHPRYNDDDIVPVSVAFDENRVARAAEKNPGAVGTADQNVVRTVPTDTRHAPRSENCSGVTPPSKLLISVTTKVTYIGNKLII